MIVKQALGGNCCDIVGGSCHEAASDREKDFDDDPHGGLAVHRS